MFDYCSLISLNRHCIVDIALLVSIEYRVSKINHGIEYRMKIRIFIVSILFRNHPQRNITEENLALSPFSTRRLFSREATFSFVGIAFADVINDADKGKSHFARKKSPSGKGALSRRENISCEFKFR